jgi:hypothetical protein
MKCNETVGKWYKNKHGASKIIDTLETYQPHDDTLEQTADSQEKAADDAAPEADLTKPSSPPGKKMTEHEFVLVSSSGEPFGPKNHVSPKIPTLRLVCLPVSSPRG